MRLTEEKTGILGRRAVVDEVLRIETPGGKVYVKKSAVEGSGDSWKRLKRRMSNLAMEKGIPFLDETEV